MKKVLVADLIKAVESEEETYQNNYNNALDQYTRQQFTVTGTSVTNWGTKETATIETISPELDEESLGTYEDILNNDINDNPSYTFEIFGYSYEIDLETLEGWINDPKMSYYNANIRVKPDPF
jgi:type II secretory pathway pseudopilin PulG